MPLYFAYGSNMDAAAMARRCPRSKPIGLARLERHRLAIMREGLLTVVRAPARPSTGCCGTSRFADVPALDRYEGLPKGLYAKILQPVAARGRGETGARLCRRQRGPGRSGYGLHRRRRRRGARLRPARRGALGARGAAQPGAGETPPARPRAIRRPPLPAGD